MGSELFSRCLVFIKAFPVLFQQRIVMAGKGELISPKREFLKYYQRNFTYRIWTDTKIYQHGKEADKEKNWA
jgi:hypothetical protein